MSDVLLFVAELVGLWCVGFAGGFLITRFKEAVAAASSE